MAASGEFILMGEVTADLLKVKLWWSSILLTIVTIILAAFFILSMVPTEVPPNFNTTIFIGNFFFLNLNYNDKIHLNYNVNKE